MSVAKAPSILSQSPTASRWPNLPAPAHISVGQTQAGSPFTSDPNAPENTLYYVNNNPSGQHQAGSPDRWRTFNYKEVIQVESKINTSQFLHMLEQLHAVAIQGFIDQYYLEIRNGRGKFRLTEQGKFLQVEGASVAK